jgi:predicted nucleic acid-binding Zn ribbon protein
VSTLSACKACGAALPPPPRTGGRRRSFCSDRCRARFNRGRIRVGPAAAEASPEVREIRGELLEALLRKLRAGVASAADCETLRKLLVDLERSSASPAAPAAEDPLEELRQKILRRFGEDAAAS